MAVSGATDFRAAGSGGANPARWLVFGSLCALGLTLLFVLYWNTFAWWWTEWTAPGSFYAHAVFVPFFVLVMIWRNRERIARAPWRPSWLGVPLLLVAMALLMLAQKSDVTTVKSISFVFLLFGVSLLTLGTARTRVLLFPLGFVVMMMPLIPDQLINSIAFPIQLASASIATKLLNLMTLNASAQGTLIQMDSYKMAVELPCSGFKTLVSLLTFSAAFAYLVEAKTWKRWVLFLTTVPLSLIINALRITFIGMAGELISAKAGATFHDWSGFIVLIMAFAFLFQFAQFLKCDSFLGIPLTDVKDEKKEAETTDETPTVAETVASEPWWRELAEWRPTPAQAKRVLPYLGTTVAVFGATAVFGDTLVKPTKSLPPIATSQVPLTFTHEGVEWKAKSDDADLDRLPKEVQEALNPNRVINRTYSGSNGGWLHFFMTAGNGRKVFHDPHTCSLGSNAILEDVGVVDIPTRHGTIHVQQSQYHLQGTESRQLVMFFYVVENKILQRTEQIRNAMIFQTLLGDSGQPSYFFRVVQNMDGTDEARKREITNFIAGMWDQIGDVLTGKRAAVYEPPPVPVKKEGE